MGYRSLVAYTIRFVGDDKKARQSFNIFLAEAKSKIPAVWVDKDNPHDADTCFVHEWLKIDEQKMQFNFYTPYEIKWYPDYDHVKAHHELWDLAKAFHEDENDKCITGQYVEVGENEDDITVKEFGYPDDTYISVSRKISCDWIDEKVE